MNKTKKENIKILAEPGIEPRTSYTAVWSGTSLSMNVSTADKRFNCFNVMGRNINEQSQICRPHLFQQSQFPVIF